MDSCRGKASTAAAIDMMRKWHLDATFGCSFALYGTDTAHLLVLAWCHKMAYYVDLWTSSGSDDAFEFTDAHHAAYNEYDALVGAAAGWAAGSPASTRHAGLRLIRPHGRALILAGRDAKVCR